MNALRQSDFSLRLLDGLRRISQRLFRRQIEGQSDYRKLSLVVDRQSRVLLLEMSEGGERNLRAGRRLHINVLERFRTLLKLWMRFQDHVVLVQLGEHGRYLALTEGVIQSVVNRLRQNSEP